jgi:hypothetical protein
MYPSFMNLLVLYIYIIYYEFEMYKYRENAVELLQRYRRDRRILLDFILSGSLIKRVVMPPGAVTLDDVDLDQVSVDYVLNCAKKGGCSFSHAFWVVMLVRICHSY